MSMESEIGLLLEKYHYEDSQPVAEIPGAKYFDRIDEETLFKNSIGGVELINKGVEYLIEHTYEEPDLEFTKKKNVLAKNLICNVIIGPDKKVMGFYLYLIQEFFNRDDVAENERYRSRYWVQGFFDSDAKFLGCGSGYDDNLQWSFY